MKKFKKILLISFFLPLIGAGVFLHPSFNGTNRYINYLHSIVYNDKVEVNCSKELDYQKIRLVFENELALIENRNSEEVKRIEERSRSQKIMRLVIFESGNQVNKIPYDYGKQRIVIYYDNLKIGEMGHWKTNRYHIHDYTVNLTMVDGTVLLSGGIKGPDQMNNYIISKNGTSQK